MSVETLERELREAVKERFGDRARVESVINSVHIIYKLDLPLGLGAADVEVKYDVSRRVLEVWLLMWGSYNMVSMHLGEDPSIKTLIGWLNYGIDRAVREIKWHLDGLSREIRGRLLELFGKERLVILEQGRIYEYERGSESISCPIALEYYRRLGKYQLTVWYSPYHKLMEFEAASAGDREAPTFISGPPERVLPAVEAWLMSVVAEA